MTIDVEKYINSGILEAYITGGVTPAQECEILHLKEKYPEIRDALFKLEGDLELLAQSMALIPSSCIRDEVEANINKIIVQEQAAKAFQAYNNIAPSEGNTQQYINVESRSSHVYIHKGWKWVFAAVFILGKIFLATAIYFYLENRHAQLQIKQLKSNTEVIK
ncbi:hypothetical protein [Mucilaginibacter boryungensis]|uniref:Uncharacterized protein n=1 Tax=Mucilaginibacter boryungensis TaxID=768480 RepID=A0ABR9XFE5_9SPHI|nr:hypothetical protein [Mucilaginibacter boryungensis]MBE9665910.1 hypothetical protein [Mucilaginibacter boryungensis]